MLDGVHVSWALKPSRFILEGTNWIAQKCLLGIEGGNPKDNTAMQITQIATILMEMTKNLRVGDSVVLPVDGLNKDHGKALAAVKVSILIDSNHKQYARPDDPQHLPMVGSMVYECFQCKHHPFQQICGDYQAVYGGVV
jgi:hypothetical protein